MLLDSQVLLVLACVLYQNMNAGHGQRGSLAQCREKFGPRPIFKIFSLDQIRVDQEKFFLGQREFGRARKF